MASERSTDVQAFIGELDGGVFETKIGAVLSEVASGVMNTKTKGKVSLNLEIEPFDENRVKIKHKLSYVRILLHTPRSGICAPPRLSGSYQQTPLCWGVASTCSRWAGKAGSASYFQAPLM